MSIQIVPYIIAFVAIVAVFLLTLLDGRWKVSASRWPWQKPTAAGPLNPSGARFGGGWDYKIGAQWSAFDKLGGTIIVDLLYGSIRIEYHTHYADEQRRLREQKAAEMRARRGGHG